MDENKEASFRVSVSLSRFFDDERALCYMWVAGGRRVRWLRRRLRRLFALPRRLCLRSRGHLLPPDEPLALLRPDDPVEVLPLTAECDWIFEKIPVESIEPLEAEREDAAEEEDVKACQQNEEINISENTEIQTAVLNNETDVSIDNISMGNLENNCELTVDNTVMTVDTVNKDCVREDEDKELSKVVSHKEIQLEKIKEHALALLASYEEPEINSSNLPDQPRPRRRKRVRRRRPRTGHDTSSTSHLRQSMTSLHSELLNAPAEPSSSLQLQCDITRCSPPLSRALAPDLPDSPLPTPSTIYSVSGVTGAAILQNNEAAPRPPRLVHTIVEGVTLKLP